jgi:hypothetical protein
VAQAQRQIRFHSRCDAGLSVLALAVSSVKTPLGTPLNLSGSDTNCESRTPFAYKIGSLIRRAYNLKWILWGKGRGLYRQYHSNRFCVLHSVCMSIGITHCPSILLAFADIFLVKNRDLVIVTRPSALVRTVASPTCLLLDLLLGANVRTPVL